jgi:hypothetical protein
MTTLIAPPRRPVENWQQKLDAWLREVEVVLTSAEEWSRSREWGTRRDRKTVTEEGLGTYEAPVLLIHTPQGRLLLDPIAVNIVGAEGRIDFCVVPSYDSWLLVREGGAWRLYTSARDDAGREWSEPTFAWAAGELVKLR